MVKSRIEIFPDIAEQIDFFEAVPEYDTAMYCHKKMKTNEENSLEVLREVLPLLEAQEDYSNDALFALLKSYVDEKGVKVGYVMWPIPYRCIRKAEYTGWSNGDHGDSRKRRVS